MSGNPHERRGGADALEHLDPAAHGRDALTSGVPVVEGIRLVEQHVERHTVVRANEVERLVLAHGVRDGDEVTFVRGCDGRLATTRLDRLR